MKEKLIVALFTINITLLIYILELPNRPTYAPGGEMFIPVFIFFAWLIGHEIRKELKGGKKNVR